MRNDGSGLTTPKGGAKGEPFSRDRIVLGIADVAAGRIAEVIKFGAAEPFAHTWRQGTRPETDADKMRILPRLMPEENADKLRAEGTAFAEKVLRERWADVEMIAAKLAKNGKISVQEKRTAIRKATMPLMIRSLDNAASYGQNDLQVTWTTGAAVKRTDDNGRPYYEVLELGPKNVRLDRLNNGAPFLNSHDPSLQSVLGVVVQNSARIENGVRGVASIRLSSRPEVSGLIGDLRDGITRGISVGYRYYAVERTKETINDVPVWRVTDWEPLELSATPNSSGCRCLGS